MLNTLISLFTSFILVGASAFGGGYAVLPMLRNTALSHGWLTAEQFADVCAFAEITPGPVALNAASYAGFTAAAPARIPSIRPDSHGRPRTAPSSIASADMTTTGGIRVPRAETRAPGTDRRR